MQNKTIAIILAAGRGIRLRPLTEDLPKPLVRINNTPILFQILSSLEKNNIKKCIIITGYKRRLIEKEITGHFPGKMDIEYIVNKKYRTTNNSYSLWLARQYLENFDTLLIEADVMADPGVFSLLSIGQRKSLWLADKFKKNMNGALLVAGKNKKIKQIMIVRERLAEYKNNYYKSVGILKIKKLLGRKLALWLDKGVKNKVTNIYYDLVLAKHLEKANIFVKYIGKLKWWEIDNQEDLEYARKLFRK